MQTNKTVNFDSDFWLHEISSLVQNAKNEVERKSLAMFESALKPLLMEPGKIQTLLSKIKAEM